VGIKDAEGDTQGCSEKVGSAAGGDIGWTEGGHETEGDSDRGTERDYVGDSDGVTKRT
jgi:hypothetical protein